MTIKTTALILCIIVLLPFMGYAQVTRIPDSLTALGDFSNAARSYTRILADSDHINRLDLGNCFMRRGNCLVNMEKPGEAIIDYFSALRIFEKLHNDDRICTAFSNLGNGYDKLNELTKASDYYRKALDISTTLNDAGRNGDLLNDIGVIEYKKGNRESAIQLHLTAIEKYKNDLSEETLCKHYVNLGNCYDEKSADSSLYYYKKAELIAADLEDSASLAGIYLNIGDVSKKKGNFKDALFYLGKSLSLNNEYGDSTDLSIIYHNLSNVYDSLHDYKNAYFYSTKEKELNDGLFSMEKSKFATELSAKYESDKKDEQIRTQATENKLKERNLLLSLMGLVLAVALGVISFISFRRKQKANIALQQQNDRIERLNKELDESNQVKSKLFSVIGHDIRGPVSSIYAYLQMQNTGQQTDSQANFSRQTEQLLDTLEDLLIWSKSQLHQFTPSFEPVDLGALVLQVSGLLKPAMDKNGLVLNNKLQQGIILHTDLNMLTIILRNILSNNIAYAVPGSVITVSAEIKGSEINLVFVNTSQPAHIETLLSRDTNSISSNTSGLGVTLITEFTQKLSGKVDYKTEGDEVFTILTLPIA